MSEPELGYEGSGGSSTLKFAILFGAIIALVAANIFLFLKIDKLEKKLAVAQENVQKQIEEAQKATTITSSSERERVESLKTQLEDAQKQARLAVGQAKADAVKHAEDLTARLAAEQEKTNTQLRSEVKAVETTASTKIEGVSTDVSSVKAEVAANKSELDKTIADLKRARGDMGEMSGLIATNGKELDALKQLGERNYFEFTVQKAKQPQRVSDVAIKLKKVDQKKGRYTIDVVADDKTVEKKDKTINEPLQFYVAKARQPYEIVVNQVSKDQIIGYLSTPKVMVPRK